MLGYDPLDGHLGNLSDNQEKALGELKDLLQENKLLIRQDTVHFWGSEQVVEWDDNTLCRFLRARKFHAQNTFQMFKDFLEWYNTDVPEAYSNFSIEELEQSKRLYPQWTGRRDREGRPVYIFNMGDLDKQVIAEYEKKGASLESRITALYEHMVHYVMPFCDSLPRPNPTIPISGSSTIVDISKVSLGQFWALRGHMTRVSNLGNARYPENSHAIYLVGAPGFFSTVWGWVCKLFDPATVAKIVILPSTNSPAEVLKHLSTHIDTSSIPIEYGGTLDFEWNKTGPKLDEEGKRLLFGPDAPVELVNKGVPKGSLRWIRPPGERSVGSGYARLAGKGRTQEEIDAWLKIAKSVAVETNAVKPDDTTSQKVDKVENKGTQEVSNQVVASEQI